jgi:lysozyme
MKTSVNGLNLIKEFESLHDGDASMIGLQPKMCPAQVWTEGYGRAMRNKSGQFLKGTKDKQEAYASITINNKQEAEQALSEDLRVFERIVSSKVRVPLNQNQFDALVSYTYNTGGSDTLFKLINQKAPEAQIKKWFETKYITAGGRTLPGLIRRRKAESTLYFK